MRGERKLAVTLREQRDRLVELAVRLARSGFGVVELGVELGSIHEGQRLPGGNAVTLLYQHLLQAAGELGCHVDALGLDTPIGLGDTGRQAGCG